jgi:hypothetical protein
LSTREEISLLRDANSVLLLSRRSPDSQDMDVTRMPSRTIYQIHFNTESNIQQRLRKLDKQDKIKIQTVKRKTRSSENVTSIILQFLILHCEGIKDYRLKN